MTPNKLVSIGLIAALGLGVAACGGDDATDSSVGDTKTEVITHYADGVEASYAASLASAQLLDEKLETFIAAPTADALEAAKQQWLAARNDYNLTEAFRFYSGPIDDEEDGPEGLINAWPMDEAYVDYVDGQPTAGIINNPTEYPEIDGDLLESLNEKDGETNIATGWHAIEFLLWGQDLSETGPGTRPVTDYTTAPNADRRKVYLSTLSELLVEHLQDLSEEWAPERDDNYRAEFEALDPDTALTNIITGIGEMSRGELAGERMSVAYNEQSQEDEQSCFSDNTTNDIIGNATGVQNVVTGNYPQGVTGPGIAALFAENDAELAAKLRDEVAESVTLAKAIPAPFDGALRAGVADDDPARLAIKKTIDALGAQTDTLVAGAKAVGLSVQVS